MSVLLHDLPRAMLDHLDESQLGSHIFYGRQQVGKATAALELARRLACPSHHRDFTDGCSVCRAFATGAYPDFHLLTPIDRPSITIEQVRRLIASLAARPYRPQAVRSVLIDSAHTLTIDAQNALLKVIEEPPPLTLIMLVTDEPGRLLATIRSRCAAVYFPPPAQADVATLVTTLHPELPADAATQLVAAAAGLPGRAIQLAADPGLATSDRELQSAALAVFGQPPFERLLLGAKIAAGSHTDLLHFAGYLQANLVGKVTAGADLNAAATGLAALERFRKHLAAGVLAKVATEALMLELAP